MLRLIASKLSYFSVSGLKDDKLIKKQQTYMKNETCKFANYILETFEYFCHILSKSITIMKDDKLIKKQQTYMKNETCKLYSRDF